MDRLTGIACLLLLSGTTLAADREWTTVSTSKTGEREGAVLVPLSDRKQMLLIGPAKGAAFVQAFDPATGMWSDFCPAGPTKESIHPEYQTAYDPGSKTVYCLSGGNVLHALNVEQKTWKSLPAATELEGMSWQALACDPAARRLVIVGADKKIDNLGSMRTVVFNLDRRTWQRLDVVSPEVQNEHRDRVAAREAVVDLVGHIRLAWYRDPRGTGTDAERAALLERCTALTGRAPLAPFIGDIDTIRTLVRDRKLLEALKSARALERRVEELDEAKYPVPCSRRNAPLVFDAKHKVFVLFGGDHEDYLMNDTWILDLAKRSWRRVGVDLAPSPRAGHALVYLPKSGKIALHEGYVQSDSTDYGSPTYTALGPVQLWLFDVGGERWDLAGSWPLPGRKPTTGLTPVGRFHGYSSQFFAPPPLAAAADDTLVLAAPRTASPFKRPDTTWTLRLDPTHTDAVGRKALGTPPNRRLYRTGPFRAAFAEVADPPTATGLDRLPENRWVKLPTPRKSPCDGCRARDWSTSVWDSDRDQILLWGGGHCVRSASTVVHYSPVSGRSVEGFDADEPYGRNGGGGFDSSVWNRPWVSPHNYKHYAYDPRCKLLVSGRGYLYDPARMDWLRLEPFPLPYRFDWAHTAVAASPHGAVAWARKKKGDDAGLWLFDRVKGWSDLEPKGKLFVPYCDSHGLVYDGKRDRMIFSSVGGGYTRTSNGTLLAFDFATKRLSPLAPENREQGRTGCARELAYVDHADWLLIGHNVRVGDPKTGRCYTRIYDCGRNRMVLLDAGPVPDGHEVGWMYDAKRKLVYAFTTHGQTWALRLDPKTARLVDTPE